MFSNYAKFIEKHNLLILIASILLVFGTFAKLGSVGTSNDMRLYFSQENPYRASLDLLEETFGKQDSLLIYMENTQGDIFDKQTLEAIANLTDSLWQTPYSRRIDSITNFQRTTAQNDELVVDFLAESPADMSDQQLQEIKAFAIQEPLLVNRLISSDAKATAINISFNLPDSNPNSVEDEPTLAAKEAKAFVDEQLNKLRAENPHLIIEAGGVIAANLAMASAVESDLGLLLPLSYLLLLGVIYFCTRSIASVVLTLIVVTLSIIASIGIFAFTGRPLTPTVGFVPTAIMAMAVADCVHYLVGYFHARSDGKEHREAVTNSLIVNMGPIIITSVTTIIGLLSLNFSEAQPYRDMGNMMAIGVGVALFLTLTFLPTILLLLPALKVKKDPSSSNIMNGLAEFVIAHPIKISAATSLLIVIAGIGFFKNEISERWYQYFNEDFEVRRSIELINENLSGIHAFHYTLNTQEENGIYNPTFWQDVDHFTQWLRKQPNVAHVDSMSDIMKSINKSMNNDNPEAYRLPEERALAAQYLLVYEFSLPQGLGMDTYANTDRSAIRLSVAIKKSNSNDMILLDKSAKNWLAKNSSTITPIDGTGMDLMFSRIAQKNAVNLLEGTAWVLVFVSCILLGVLRSLKIGIISLVPNLTPALLAYGIWGYFNGVIDLSSSVVICISLGIVVDDTVHFLSKYRLARIDLGLSTEDAIRYSFKAVGNALFITTLALVAGFLITVFSSFLPSANLGALLALTLGLALVVDLLLLPALLLLFDKEQSKRA